ncbi:hypothetical protein CDCA_CDCA09G2764 [Cyanidium caldarium]|uniref:Uncharacterized protein n=1 Tax=Cyanidium caldarium TaxID=2771 RepID=A0AAV9IWT1_CYACA|nr:hypothetical protein CDCA_CDCA09G2764 [Cyanidium caldarium]
MGSGTPARKENGCRGKQSNRAAVSGCMEMVNGESSGDVWRHASDVRGGSDAVLDARASTTDRVPETKRAESADSLSFDEEPPEANLQLPTPSAPGGLVEERRRRYEHLDKLLKAATLYTTVVSEQIRQQQEANRQAAMARMQAGSSPGKRRGKGQAADGLAKLQTLVQQADAEQTDMRRTEARHADTLQPAELTGGTLRDYQLAGLEWLKSLYENGINGILADEMGLGKTVQCIALICHLREMGVRGPFLIVGPLTVIPNWIAEFRRFAPAVPVLLYHGTKEERTLLRQQYMPTRGRAAAAAKMPVVVTSYEIIMRDRAHLNKHAWAYIIIDEGHRIKNMDCQLVRELRSYTSANRLLITGTPLQNNLDELWSLLHFLMPDIFDSVELFREWFDFGADVALGAIEKQQEDAIVTKLHAILRPFLLRRLKADVEQRMPRKREVHLFAPLTPLQREYYHAIMQNRIHEVLERKRGAGFTRNLSLKNQFMQLRKVCCHPYLLAEPEENFHGEVPLTDERLVQAAGKLALADRLLPRLRQRGHKVLLYSQFTTMLDVLEDYLRLRGHKYCRIDGTVKFEERIQQMEAFNAPESDIFIFLLSTRAGGLGLNLQAADTVLLYDSDPNPQMDLQAMDRCHRIGQTRPVHVYRLVTPNSVEESMLQRAVEKRKLERLVVRRSQFARDEVRREVDADREVSSGAAAANAPETGAAGLSFDEVLARQLAALEDDQLCASMGMTAEEVDRELRALLHFKAAEAEYGSGGQITDANLDALMDREDMLDRESDTAEEVPSPGRAPKRVRRERLQSPTEKMVENAGETPRAVAQGVGYQVFESGVGGQPRLFS